jgi:PAS domain S-box-containing protein
MYSRRQLISPVIAAAISVTLGVVALFWSFSRIEIAANARNQAHMALQSAEDLMSELNIAEASQRGYSLTGDDAFLEPYRAVRDTLKTRQYAVTPLIAAKLADMDRVISLRLNHDLSASSAATAGVQGGRLMEAVRSEMASAITLAEEEVRLRNGEFQSNMGRLFLINIASSLLTLFFAIAFVYLLYRQAQQRLKHLVHTETEGLLKAQEETNRQLQRANTTLLLSEEKLAVTLQSIGDAVIATDAQARVTLLNPMAQRLTGWTLDEALGRPIAEVFRIINRETRLPAKIPVIETLLHGTLQALANHTVLLSREGRSYDIADTCAPIRDRDSRVIGAVLVFRDVTSDYAVQQALRDSSALVETVLNTVADGIVTLHANGGIMATANPAIETMFGYMAIDLIGQPLHMLIPELNGDEVGGSIAYYSASDGARANGTGREVQGCRKDGRRFPLEMTVAEMEQGNQRYFTGILRDITARKTVETQRQQLDQDLQTKNVELDLSRRTSEKANLAKSEFLSSMSHELRSPLNAILGFSQLLQTGAPPPTATQKANIEHILQAGWYLLDLINEILDLSLIESGKLSMSLEPISLEEVLLDCRSLMETQAQKSGIRVDFPVFSTPCFISADRTRLKQILVNLLSNAIKYNRVHGTVQVICSALTDARRVRISVSDTGEGLSPEKLSALFQPFNRLGQESGVEEGTGIGLVVSKQLVELMGGELGVNSSVGVGSQFWFELNEASASQLELHTAPPPIPTHTEVSINPKTRTLLYVEDNRANMELVEQIITRRPDMRLIGASDGIRGIALTRVHHPDVILMDINLPGINGLQALKILRQDPATASIPVLALSANAMPRDIERGLEAGFLRYLTKPIKIFEFMEALDEALAQGNKEKSPITAPIGT